MSVLSDAVSFFANLEGVGEELAFVSPHSASNPVDGDLYSELLIAAPAATGATSLLLEAPLGGPLIGRIPAGLRIAITDQFDVVASVKAEATANRITVPVGSIPADVAAGTLVQLERAVTIKVRGWPFEFEPDRIDGTVVRRGDRPYRVVSSFKLDEGAQLADGRTVVAKEPMGPTSAPNGYRIILGARS